MTTEIVQTAGALAIRPDQIAWTDDQAAVLRQSGISNDVTPAELSGFLHLCQRTGLDPFSRQIYLIGRKDKRANRVVYTPQTGIDGYRVVARRATANSGGTYGYEDTLWCDTDGRWRDVWLADTPPAAAKVTVLRDGQKYSAVALFREYVQTGWEGKHVGLWGKMPAGQLAKCAEALALRKAFPHDLAGVYTAEEMAQADDPVPEVEPGEVRQLQHAQPGQDDPWTARPEVTNQGPPAMNGRNQQAQDFATSAAKATTPSEIKDIYRQANAAGLLAETVKSPDRELLELGAYLIACGQQLAAPAPDPGQVLEGEVVPDPPDEAAAAEKRARAAAKRAQIDADTEFEASYGLPIGEAGASQLNEFAALLEGAP